MKNILVSLIVFGLIGCVSINPSNSIGSKWTSVLTEYMEPTDNLRLSVSATGNWRTIWIYIRADSNLHFLGTVNAYPTVKGENTFILNPLPVMNSILYENRPSELCIVLLSDGSELFVNDARFVISTD
jgi:hypothetical protein